MELLTFIITMGVKSTGKTSINNQTKSKIFRQKFEVHIFVAFLYLEI